MGRPLYVDLDATLIDSDVDELGNVTHIEARPGAAQFLQKLSKHGDLFLLTHAMEPHVKNAFRVIGKPSRLFTDVISREDMAPIIEMIDFIIQDERLTMEEKGMLYQEIEPLAQGFGGEIAGAAVHADRQRTPQLVAGTPTHQGQGQIVDGLIAEILEDLEGGGMAGTGQAGHQHHRQAFRTG